MAIGGKVEMPFELGQFALPLGKFFFTLSLFLNNVDEPILLLHHWCVPRNGDAEVWHEWDGAFEGWLLGRISHFFVSVTHCCNEEVKEEDEQVNFNVQELLGQITSKFQTVVNDGIDSIYTRQEQHAKDVNEQLHLINERVEKMEIRQTMQGHDLEQQQQLQRQRDLTIRDRDLQTFIAQTDPESYLHMEDAKDKLWELHQENSDEYYRARESHDTMDGCKVKDAMQRKVYVLVDGKLEVIN